MHFLKELYLMAFIASLIGNQVGNCLKQDKENSLLSVYSGKTSAKLTHLPPDVAEEIKWMAWDASWHTANTRARYYRDATADKMRFEKHAENIQDMVKGLGISLTTVDAIKWGAWAAAWHTANTRVGYYKDAARDKREFEERFQQAKNAGELADSLVDNIKWMSWNAAWHCANTRKGYYEDAKSDKLWFEKYFTDICGETLLVGIKFYTDKGKILSDKPLKITEQMLENESDLVQSQVLKVSLVKSKTKSWSNKVGFKVGIKTSVKVGFNLISSVENELSFETSYEKSWGESETQTETVTYEFPVKSSPHSRVIAKATIHEAVLDVPYEMVFEVGGIRRTSSGIWRGVAYSKVTFSLKQV